MNGLACWRVTLCVDGTMFCHPVTRCDPVHYDDISVPRAVYPDMIAFLAGREDINCIIKIRLIYSIYAKPDFIQSLTELNKNSRNII